MTEMRYPLVISEPVPLAEISEMTGAVFYGSDKLSLRAPIVHIVALDYLVSCLRYRPQNLHIHVQRIFLSYQLQLEAPLYAALADCFWLLGGAGLALKKRLLWGSQKYLAAEDFDGLKSTLQSAAPIVPNKYCVLVTVRAQEHYRLVDVLSCEDIASAHDPLLIARAFIEYSQLGEAQLVLETAILEDPERLELHEDLLELYRYTRDVEAFNTTRLRLLEQGSSLPAQWQVLVNFFNT